MSNLNVQMILSLLYNGGGAKQALEDVQAIEKAAASIGKTSAQTAPAWVQQERAITTARNEAQKLTNEMRTLESVGGRVGASFGGGGGAWTANVATGLGKLREESRLTTEQILRDQAKIKKAAAEPASPWGEHAPGSLAKRRRGDANSEEYRADMQRKYGTPAGPPHVAPAPLPPKPESGKPEASKPEEDTTTKTIARGAAGVAAYVTGEKVIEVAKETSRAGEHGRHSAISLETQGNTPDEVKGIQEEAAKLSRLYTAFSRTSIEHMIGDAKSMTGSLDHAYEVMPTLLKLRTLEQGQTGASSDADSKAIVKAAELAGIIGGGDHAKTEAWFDTVARLRNVYKDTFRADDVKQLYAASGASASLLSREFMEGTGGHLLQEMGGDKLGNDIAMLNRMAGGRASGETYQSLLDLGVPLDQSKIERNTKGRIMKVHPGVMAPADQKMLFTDPDKWLLKFVKPGFDQLPEDQQLSVEQGIFGNISQLKFADKVLRQGGIIEKDRQLVRGAQGIDAWKTWQERDPALNRVAMFAQLENLGRDIADATGAGSPYLKKALTNAIMNVGSKDFWGNVGLKMFAADGIDVPTTPEAIEQRRKEMQAAREKMPVHDWFGVSA